MFADESSLSLSLSRCHCLVVVVVDGQSPWHGGSEMATGTGVARPSHSHRGWPSRNLLGRISTHWIEPTGWQAWMCLSCG